MSKFYPRLFAKFYDAFMKSFELKIEKDRHEMLFKLSGKVLDVGSGTGVNFKYFNDTVNVLAIEPSKAMQDKSLAKIGNKQIELMNVGATDDLLYERIRENSLDAIAEIIGGALLIIPKTRALGAIVLFPVVVGIFLFHAAMDPGGMAISVVLLIFNLWIIFENKDKYMHMIS